MNRSNHTRTARLTTLALLAALVVVLQTLDQLRNCVGLGTGRFKR